MKAKLLQMTSIVTIVSTLFIITSCKNNDSKNEYLQKVFDNLNNIKYASYSSNNYISAPYDTLFIRDLNEQTEVYFNPKDTAIASSYVSTIQSEGIKTSMIYDGKTLTYIDWQDKRLTIDSIKPNTSRSLSLIFYGQIKTILKYVRETKDNVSVEIISFKDSIKISLFIPNKIIEFYERPYIRDDPNLSENEEFSRYDIWINKTDDLPFKLRRHMPHQTTQQVINNVEFNKKKIEDFKASDYFPKDFAIGFKGDQISKKDILLGKVAPKWVLKDVNNNIISLQDLESKILVIQFTGIGCGPCHASIPFIKQLINDYKDKDFEFVCIETWNRNIDGIARYCKINELNFKYLISTEEVTKDYQVDAVPIFYILDRNQIIRKILIGYSEKNTDNEIRNAVKSLI